MINLAKKLSFLILLFFLWSCSLETIRQPTITMTLAPSSNKVTRQTEEARSIETEIIPSSVLATNQDSRTPQSQITWTSESTPVNSPTLTKVSPQISSLDGMMMVYVSVGPFEMGSSDEEIDYAIENCIPEEHPDKECPRHWFKDEQPQHEVYLDAYWIDQTEVTNEMYAHFLNATGANGEVIVGEIVRQKYLIDTIYSKIDYKEGFWYPTDGYDEHPVTGVTWNGASAYCEWAGKRLPTEAEWEKAARGTDGWIFPWGDEDINCNRANYGGCVGGTTPVGSYPEGASPYGAHDMIGNAWEWVHDWFEEDYYSRSPYANPSGPIIDDEPIMGWPHGIRGGWALGNPGDIYTHRTAARWSNVPANSSEVTGFRCVSFSTDLP